MRQRSELEQNFIRVLDGYTDRDGTGREDLFRAYCRLTGSFDDDPETRDRKLKLVCGGLIRALDRAPDGEVAEVLYLYTFRDFLEYYAGESAVQAVIRELLDKNELSKLPLRIALGLRR